MGQAKARGSFQQRQIEGIARLNREADEREHRTAEMQRKETERRMALYHSDLEQYEREKQSRNCLGTMVAMLAGMMANSHHNERAI